MDTIARAYQDYDVNEFDLTKYKFIGSCGMLNGLEIKFFAKEWDRVDGIKYPTFDLLCVDPANTVVTNARLPFYGKKIDGKRNFLAACQVAEAWYDGLMFEERIRPYRKGEY